MYGNDSPARKPEEGVCPVCLIRFKQVTGAGRPARYCRDLCRWRKSRIAESERLAERLDTLGCHRKASALRRNVERRLSRWRNGAASAEGAAVRG